MRMSSKLFTRSRRMRLYDAHYVRLQNSVTAMEDHLAVVPSLLRPLESLPQCNESAFGLLV